MVPTVANMAVDCANAYQFALLRSEVTGQPVHPEGGPGDAETRITLPDGSAPHFDPGRVVLTDPEGNEFRILLAEAERASLPRCPQSRHPT
ncbi:hypothetical protein ACFQZ0_13920 [Streptomyces erythrogriseus]|uniref:Glyoxalase-like domain-containing protein n=1 Tax=Streptomyces erythrogriseus TaxID=284027 RepID=A0ABP6JUY6_9ACTN|nr:hypothetical protein [Streptomyces vinaceus]